TGKTLQGSYVAGVWFPDKTRVGWWKNGYPDYFAKVINSVNWIGVDVEVEGQAVNLAEARILEFHREINLETGTLMRFCTLELTDGKQIRIHTHRFCSIDN